MKNRRTNVQARHEFRLSAPRYPIPGKHVPVSSNVREIDPPPAWSKSHSLPGARSGGAHPRRRRGRVGRGNGSRQGSRADANARQRLGHPLPLLPPTSFWNTRLPADARSTPARRKLVAASAATARGAAAGRGPSISTTSNSVPIYRVGRRPADGAGAARSAPPVPALRPPGARCRCRPRPSPRRATTTTSSSGSRAPTASGSSGAWPTAPRLAGRLGRGDAERLLQLRRLRPRGLAGRDVAWGGSASSLSIAGGLITLEDLEAGKSTTPWRSGVPNVRAGVYALPAAAHRRQLRPTRWPCPRAPTCGSIPTSTSGRLHLPPLTLMIAEPPSATGSSSATCAGERRPSTARTRSRPGANPYAGPNGYFEGTYPARAARRLPLGRTCSC